MSETKTYIVPDNQGNGLNDFAAMAMMNNGGMNGMNGMWNNPFVYLVWMYMMRWMNNGWGDQNNGEACTQRQLQTLQDQMQDNHNTDLIMQGINGNSAAIREASDKIGCNFNALNTAICGVNNSIAQLSSQTGFSAERIINAVNTGDCNVIQALKDCCCNTQKTIIELGYLNLLANERQTYSITNTISNLGSDIQRGFTTSDFQTQTQTCALQNAIRDTGTSNTNAIIAKLDAMQSLNLLDKIDALRERNAEQAVVINNAQLSNLFGQMITAAVTPINSALTNITKELADVQCRMPLTVTLPANTSVAVPTCVAANYGLFGGCGYYGNNGLWG